MGISPMSEGFDSFAMDVDQQVPASPARAFAGPTCRGSYILGSACGRCERCAAERLALVSQPAPKPIAEPQPVVLVLPYPPSVNTYWRHLSKGPLAGRTLISEQGRNYRKAVIESLLVERIGKAPEGNLAVTIEARMPDRRKRDLDNIPKAMLDALTHAGFWVDDSLIDDLRVWRSDLMGGQIIVTIEPFVRPGRLL